MSCINGLFFDKIGFLTKIFTLYTIYIRNCVAHHFIIVKSTCLYSPMLLDKVCKCQRNNHERQRELAVFTLLMLDMHIFPLWESKLKSPVHQQGWYWPCRTTNMHSLSRVKFIYLNPAKYQMRFKMWIHPLWFLKQFSMLRVRHNKPQQRAYNAENDVLTVLHTKTVLVVSPGIHINFCYSLIK